jgi:alpha-beta hydrolase superfamily lysophospholipase
MTEIAPPRVDVQTASDGYPIHVAVWPAVGTVRGRVVVLHGVQSHCGWYGGLGQRLSAAGYEVHMPDRRGSGHNTRDRGDTPSSRRLIDDVAEKLDELRRRDPRVPQTLAGISWGGKLVVATATRYPERVDALALICPGLSPRVGVSLRERLRIAWCWFFAPRSVFPIPLGDPALFTASREGREFIAADPLGLYAGTARLMAASMFLDRAVRRGLTRVQQPALLMLAGEDRIIDNVRTRESFEALGSARKTIIEYPEAHHTLEFEPDPARYARDLVDWLEATLGGNQDMPPAVGNEDQRGSS